MTKRLYAAISFVCFSSCCALFACVEAAPPASAPAKTSSAPAPTAAAPAGSAAPSAAQAPAASGNPTSGPLSGMLEGKPFTAKSALAAANNDGSLAVNVFDVEVSCDKLFYTKSTTLWITTPWAEDTSVDGTVSLVTFDKQGMPFTRPLASGGAKITFGKKPMADAPSTIAISAKGKEGEVSGSIPVKLCRK